MSFWNSFSDMFSQDAKKYKTLALSPQRVDVEYDASPIKAGEAYCRLWLVEMRLAKGVEWGSKRYPVVHSAIRVNYGGKVVTIPYLAGPDLLQEIAGNNLDRIIQYNRPLTPLFPFNQGDVELQAGLLSVVATDWIDKFISTLGRFTKPLPTPELSTVLNIAEPLYGGIQDLFGVGQTRLELGYQQTFTGAGSGGGNDLQPGYFVTILAVDRQVDEDSLCIINDSLQIGAPGKAKEFVSHYHQDFSEYSYMLFRLEQRTAQDWESLTSIKELVYKAQEAVVNGKYNEAKEVLTALKIAIFRTPDLVKADKRPMILKIEAVLEEWGLQAAKGPISKPSLFAIMQRALPEVDAQKEDELDALEALFAIEE